MNLNECADSSSVGNFVERGAITALKRNKQKSILSSFYEEVSLKRSRIKDFVVIAAAVLLLVLWTLNFNSLDLGAISFGNAPGGSDLGFQGRGEIFNLLP